MSPTLEYVLILCAAGAATLYGLLVCLQALRAQQWPSVEGEIASTRLVYRSDADGGSDYPYVAYRYRVAGKPYRGDRVRFGPQVLPSSVVPALDPAPGSPSASQALAARYPRGQQIRVYYNPRNPADSVLHPSPNATVWCILIAGIVFGAAALNALL